MSWFLSFLLCGLLVQISVAPPVTKDKADDEQHKDKEDNNLEAMEYHRYLKEVADALGDDPDFHAKIAVALESDIRSGKIADELKFVDPKIRTKLDELKRAEMERLRHLAIKENQLKDGLDLQHLKIAQHVDHKNAQFFEIDDLKKLIAKTTEDLLEADRRRRQQFKEYEMQKKFEQEQKMKAMNEEEKKKYVEQLQELKEKHKKHGRLHHPGSKQQLEEIWEDEDDMDSEDFDLRKFFYFHDIDSNGVWDQNEVKALFVPEVSKLYAAGAPESDFFEREEELERMREHLFNEADLNKDGLISYQEFVEHSKKPHFEQDPGWTGLDEQQVYSQEEYEAFEKRRREEIQALVSKGVISPHEGIAMQNQQLPPQRETSSGHPQGGDNSVSSQQYQNQGQPIQQQYQQQIQVPQQNYQGHVPIQQQYQQQIQVPQQNYQGHIPIQQQQQQHHQQQQQHHQQQQQQQQHYNQIPQQQYQGQMMPQGGQFHGQVQLESNQIPVQHQQLKQEPVQPMQHQQTQHQNQLPHQQNIPAQVPQQQHQNQQQAQYSNVQAQIPQQQQQQPPAQQQQQQNQQQQNQHQQQNTLNQIPQQQKVTGPKK